MPQKSWSKGVTLLMADALLDCVGYGIPFRSDAVYHISSRRDYMQGMAACEHFVDLSGRCCRNHLDDTLEIDVLVMLTEYVLPHVWVSESATNPSLISIEL